MTSLFLASAAGSGTLEVSVTFALEWLSWIILIAGFVACLIAIMIKLLYAVLSLFPKKPESKTAKH
ncbi:MAG: hypothetical protein K6B46_02800 [Opitutales bacterium]|nr:hypothetical protein [Opitutales bacterium]